MQVNVYRNGICVCVGVRSCGKGYLRSSSCKDDACFTLGCNGCFNGGCSKLGSSVAKKTFSKSATGGLEQGGLEEGVVILFRHV